MALSGSAALAMWWDMAADVRSEFEHWHSHEHFPERLAIPGFRRGTRWRSVAGEGIFVMYELADYDVLSSASYVARLNAPTPWSTRMMPHHRNMVRSQCRVLHSQGGGVACHALTVRLSPQAGSDQQLLGCLSRLADNLVMRPGITGAHLLKHQTPPMALTTEQKIRNSADQVADWVFVVCGYELPALELLAQAELTEQTLASQGAARGVIGGVYGVSFSAVPADVS